MASVNRLLVTNSIQATATVLTASSAATGSPVSRLKDQLRSKTWRSAIGWTISDQNSKIDFDRGGVKVASVASGTYATGAALATAIVTALEAADATPVWACSYDAGTKKFTISSDLAFTLLFGTGANKANGIAKDLGFTESDTASATSHTAGSVSYQSRQAITVDLGAAAAITAAIVINHNGGAGGTFKFQASSTSFAGGNWGFAGNPTFNQTLSGDASIRIAFFAEQSYRYLRLLVDDVQNTLGYSEVGVWFAGSYVEAVRGFAPGWQKSLRPQNDTTFAIGGAHFTDQKPNRPAWTAIKWPGQVASERDTLMAAFATVPAGTCFFFTFDSENPTTQTEYVMLGDDPTYAHMDGEAFLVQAPALLGALG